MATEEALTLRRRAACAALSAVLDEEALLDALRLQHQSMRGDAVADIIRYIDQIAQQHHIEAPLRKKLYETFYKALRLPEAQLPMDPWPLMYPQPPSAPAPAPAVAPPSAAAQAAHPPAVAAVPAPMAAPARPPAQGVCADLMRSALADVQRFHPGSLQDLGNSALDLVDTLKVPPSLRRTLRELWTRPLQAHWVLDLPAAELPQVVHLLYLALCEALGPVEADRVLTRAVRSAEQGPLARQFSPRRLL